MYKELLINMKKTTQLENKQELNRHFTKRDIQVANKHIKKSTSLVREI